MNVHSLTEQGLFLSVCGRYQTGWDETNIDPMWKVLLKEADLGEPTSFLDHVYLGCTQNQFYEPSQVVHLGGLFFLLTFFFSFLRGRLNGTFS